MSKQKSGPADVLIGQKLKDRRLELSMSQQQIAASIGVTFQQIQKYERGTNRISSSKLNELANLLKVGINYFFSNDKDYEFADDVPSFIAEEQTEYGALPKKVKDQLKELINHFINIKDDKLRQNIIDVVKSLENK